MTIGEDVRRNAWTAVLEARLPVRLFRKGDATFGVLDGMDVRLPAGRPIEEVFIGGRNKDLKAEYAVIALDGTPPKDRFKRYRAKILRVLTLEEYNQELAKHPLRHNGGLENLLENLQSMNSQLVNDLASQEIRLQAEIDKVLEPININRAELEALKTDLDRKEDCLAERESLIRAMQDDHDAFKAQGGLELLAALRARRLPAEQVPGHVVPLPSDLIVALSNRLRAQHHVIAEDVLRRWVFCTVASLLVGQLTLLSGPTGVGKTSLNNRMAEALGLAHTVIPVRPAWLEATDLLGHYSVRLGAFVPTPFTEALMAAVERGRMGRVSMVTLDEINLSRIEDYAADLISQHEKAFAEGTCGELRLYALPPHAQPALLDLPSSADLHYPPRVTLPDTLLLSGTLNLDRAGEHLSPKVLDRAYVLQISESWPDTLPPFVPTVAAGAPIWTLTHDTVRGRMHDVYRQEDYAELHDLMADTWRIISSWKHVLDVLKLPVSRRSQQAYQALCHAGLLTLASDTPARGPDSDTLAKETLSFAADTYILTKVLPWLSMPSDDPEQAQALRDWCDMLQNPELLGFSGSRAAVEALVAGLDRPQHLTYLG